jgi:MYXO-CTERM domain-containing protein
MRAFIAAAATSLIVAASAPAAAQPVAPLARSGPQKVAVIVAKYSHTPDDFRTFEEIREAVFTGERSASAWFQEASYGSVRLVGKVREDGDVFGPVTLSFDDANCIADLRRTYDDALVLARAVGFDPAGYDKVIVNVPNSDVCGERGGGRAEVGGRRIWMHGRASPWVVAHELLHSYGFHHANGLDCRAADGARVALGGTCSSRDRADRTDIMGSASQYKHLGAYLKSLLGWIPAANVTEVTRSGTHTLLPVEMKGPGIQSLRIPYDTSAGIERVIEIDYRQPLGFSAPLGLQSYGGSAFETASLSGVYLRLGPRDPRRYAASNVNLIDVDTATSGFEPLLPGQAFSDPDGRVRIDVVSATATGAVVNVVVRTADGGAAMTADLGVAPAPPDAAAAAPDAAAPGPDAAPDVVAAPAPQAPDARPPTDPATKLGNAPGASGGCGCRAPGSARLANPAMPLALVAIVALRRRRPGGGR